MASAEQAGSAAPVQRNQGIIAFVLVILTWASMPLFLKYFTAFLDGWTVNGLRYGVAILIWLPFLLWHLQRRTVTPGIFKDACIPAAGHLMGQVCWGLSPYYNDASIMHFIGRSTFLFMIVFGFLLLHEERRLIVRPVFWVGVAGTVAGVICMYLGGARHGATSPLGVLLLLGAGAGWALYGVTVKKYMGRHSARLSFAVISLYSGPTLIALMFVFGDWRLIPTLTLSTWGWLVLSAATGIAMAHVLLYVALKRYGPIVTDGVFQLIPFMTVLGAYLLFGERMTALQWAGGFILIGAAYALLIAKRQTHIRRIADTVAPG